MLVINGDSDPRTPLPGVQESVAAARRAYAALGADEKLGFYLQPNAGHVFTPVAELVDGGLVREDGSPLRRPW